MLFFQLKDYNEFKEIFGTKTSSRGCIANKILLSFWKYRFQIDKDGRASQIRTMKDLFNVIIDSLNNHLPYREVWRKQRTYTPLGDGGWERYESYRKYSTECNVYLPFKDFGTKRFFCKDYFNQSNTIFDLRFPGKLSLTKYETGTVEHISAGKFLMTVFEDNQVKLPENVKLYAAEEFQRLVDSETSIGDYYELVVDKDFKSIYTSKKLEGDFHSCMNDRGHHPFYEKCVDASAAALYDKRINKIVARCIIYHNVYSFEDGKLHNYAERHYAADVRNLYILNKFLVEGGYCDLYKTVGAGCHDVRQIVSVKTGQLLKNSRLAINCHIGQDDVISYLDTFRFYDYNNGIAYNDYNDGHYCQLDTTSDHIDYYCKLKRNEVLNRSLPDFFRK